MARRVKNPPPANAGDVRDASLIPGSERCTEGQDGSQLQYYSLETPMDRGAIKVIPVCMCVCVCVCMYIHIFRFLSVINYYMILNMVPCVI